jgi:hypothetical protein
MHFDRTAEFCGTGCPSGRNLVALRLRRRQDAAMADDLLLVRARELWVELADTPVEFCPSGGAKVVVAPRSRLSPPSWTGIVRIGNAAIVTAPSVRAAGMVDDAARKMTHKELVDRYLVLSSETAGTWASKCSGM